MNFLSDSTYLAILGTLREFRSSSVACGFLMTSPNTDYPTHHHESEEICVVLAGRVNWTKPFEGYLTRPPGAVIRHPSQFLFEVKARAETLLVLCLWHSGDLAWKREIGGG